MKGSVLMALQSTIKSLAETNPELAAQWHPTKNGDLRPTDVTANSNKKVWWILHYDDLNSGRHFDFEWQTTVYHRAICGTKCPYLINQAILPGFNDLYTTNPALAKEWHPVKNKNLTPSEVVGGSDKKVWWKCARGHEWQATINSRNKGVGCPYCMGKEAITGYNDLKTVNPVLANEWNYEKNNGLTPMQVLPNSNKKAWWICENGHEWQAVVSSRNQGCGCPICSGRQVLVGFNDLETLNPTVASEWHPTKNGNFHPSMTTCGSGKKAWWRCNTCGHEWEASVCNRTIHGRGCPECARKARRLTYKNRIASEHINQINTMNCGLKCKIIRYDSSTNIIVKFENGIEKQTSYGNFKKGAVSPN